MPDSKKRQRNERVTLDPECAKILREMIDQEGFRTMSGAARALIIRGREAYLEDKFDGF